MAVVRVYNSITGESVKMHDIDARDAVKSGVWTYDMPEKKKPVEIEVKPIVAEEKEQGETEIDTENTFKKRGRKAKKDN